MFKNLILAIIIDLFHVIKILSAQNPQCMEKSFDLALNSNQTDLNSKSIQIYYTITISKDIQAKNESDYMAKCIKSIIFKYRPINSDMNTIVIEQPYEYRLTNTFTFTNLTFLSMYMIDISFRQVVQYTNCEITMELEKIKNIFLNTCFGRPSMPLNLKSSLSISGLVFNSSFVQLQTSFKMSWDKPNEINSPMLSYYHIVLVDFAMANLTQIQTTQNEFTFLASSNISFYIAAVNDASMFASTSSYPFVTNCKMNKLLSQYSQFTYAKNPNDFYSFGQVDSLDLARLEVLFATMTTTTTATAATGSTTTTTNRSVPSGNSTTNVTETVGTTLKSNNSTKPNTLSKSNVNRFDWITFYILILILIIF